MKFLWGKKCFGIRYRDFIIDIFGLARFKFNIKPTHTYFYKNRIVFKFLINRSESAILNVEVFKFLCTLDSAHTITSRTQF